MKIKINSDIEKGQMVYSHLDPVVDYLLDSGNGLAHAYRWGSNREGYFCHLLRPIDFNSLLQVFDFPDEIVVAVDNNVIYAEKTGCIIKWVGG
ncbi:hypothetical protein LN449_07630 [Xanthomonas cannabis]|uniref:hypothetical protein n=1 Tax=Xanthomonas cannabis TaxID=1885674 RepID=UPI001E598E64|nr:hypothetical protein [Xanthomonas cannabis]MCC8442380.1 hypothetical protein [Xanthomonas cannabis]